MLGLLRRAAVAGGIALLTGLLAGSGGAGVSAPTFAPAVDGDRPWLAAAGANTVYMATDTVEGSGSGHEVFVSTDGGQTCSANGIPDNGSLADGGSYTGFGKLRYDPKSGNLVEPAVFNHGD